MRAFLALLTIFNAFLEAESLSESEREFLRWPRCKEDKTCLFNSSQLRSFDGAEESAILVSVVSHVFDVTKSAQYYGKDQSYWYMAGRDSSRTLGKMSDDEEDVTSHRLDDLNDKEWEELFNWIKKINKSYDLVGRLIDWKPGVTLADINKRSGLSLKPVTQSQQHDASEL